MTWGEFKAAVEKEEVKDTDVITGFRWFNDKDSKYYVTVWFERRPGDKVDKKVTHPRPPKQR